ncbi:MAG TPA: acyl-CoA dehydrogenase family protein [Streptosporangiaceae bacterium]|jgi:alkylation response protein AidB-like acyl-CoA dehydrogenase|nr:acyl-CoA dehydrogenase family protein [Streptosporangiaceae bacterium]
MDARLTTEQQDLRNAAARLADDLGPGSVSGLADTERVARLEKAVAAAGWRNLRSDGASAVEVALVAEEFGRGLVDVAFLGPVLADDLRRGAGLAADDPPVTIAVDREAVDARGIGRVLALDGNRLLAGQAGAPAPGADLTRPGAALKEPLTPAGELPAGEAERWHALGLVVTSADLLGAARGAHALACDYARVRTQYGNTIGSYQAVAHPLAEGLALIEGCVSVLRHAAWAVDELVPAAALRAARTAKVYCARAARTICETAVQVHGGIGNTWDCLVHVYLRRVLADTGLFPARLEEAGPVPAPAGDAPAPSGSAAGPDYRDAPAEAAFRDRLRAWLAGRAAAFPASGDEYWARQGEWHQALHRAGFFGLSWPRAYGGQDLPPVYDVILDEELARAGAPPQPSLGYLVQGLRRHAREQLRRRFLPGLIDGTQRWCQGFSEPGAGSDLASLTTTATREPGGDYAVHGHKIWTSYSDVADWCLLLARTDPDAPRHRGLSAFVISMRQPGVEQRPLRMMNGVTTEFGQVFFDGARVPAGQMVGVPGEGWALAMTVVGHEREPAELGYSARYGKLVRDLAARVPGPAPAELAWAAVQTEMLRLHVRRRLSERLDGVAHGPAGSLDKLLMTWVEQAAGHAALAVGGVRDEGLLSAYLYSRAQSVMGGTSQIQKNIIAARILGLGA